MAFTISNEASAFSITSTLTLALTATAAAGTMLVLGVASDNAGASGAASISSVTDSAGNLWVNRSQINRTAASAVSDGTTLSIWSCTVATALVAGTVTLNFSPATTAKAAILYKVTPAAGEMVIFASAGTGATGSGASWVAPTVSVNSGDTIFGFKALESQANANADTDTTNGSWSSVFNAAADTGANTTSQAICAQYKTVTATGNQTYDTGTGGARDYAVNTIILSPVTATFGAAGVGAASFEATAIAAATFAAAGAGAASFIAIRPRTGTFRGAGRGTARWVSATARPVGSRSRSLRILAQFDWMADTTSRLWDGGGPWVDGDGNVWIGAGSFGDLDEIEQAINGEAATINLRLSGVQREESTLAWLAYTNDQIVGSAVTILIQSCDDDDQPIGSPEIRFAGTIDDIAFRDAVTDRRPVSTIEVPVVNKFTVRRLTSGAVLSDADQKARSAILNPGAEPDLFCERVPLLADLTITWPRWN